jgi:hypothetical protein
MSWATLFRGLNVQPRFILRRYPAMPMKAMTLTMTTVAPLLAVRIAAIDALQKIELSRIDR